MAPETGAEAPDFTLRNQNREEVTLSSFRGKRSVLLVFFPFAFSSICTGELSAVRDDLTSFQNDDVQVLGISVDHPFALKAWADAQDYEFPLLSDFWPHGEVSRAYGVFAEDKGCAVRGTFIVDKEGVVRWTVVNALPDARDLGEYIAALDTL
jgi:mycoredoxin-dependent peroxiredoxin